MDAHLCKLVHQRIADYYERDYEVLNAEKSEIFDITWFVLRINFGNTIHRRLCSLKEIDDLLGYEVTEHSCMNEKNRNIMPWGWQKTQTLARLFSPGKNLLMLGTGAGDLCRYFSTDNQYKITAVEIDPTVIRLARNTFFLWLPVITADVHDFIKITQEKYDTIFVDMCVPTDLGVSHVGDEFWINIKKRLTPKGIAAINWPDYKTNPNIKREIGKVDNLLPSFGFFHKKDVDNLIQFGFNTDPNCLLNINISAVPNIFVYTNTQNIAKEAQ